MSFFKEVKAKYPDQLFMADCSTVEEAVHADALGFDFIGTTMVGYTKQSEGDKIEENDFEILRTIVSKVNIRSLQKGISIHRKKQKEFWSWEHIVLLLGRLSQDHSLLRSLLWK